MQDLNYGKRLIYYRPIFRLTKFALCRSASPACSFVLFYTLSDVWLQTSAFKQFLNFIFYGSISLPSLFVL